MKFTKVVILASALAVPTFSISGFAKAADAQTVIVPQADRNSAEAEKSKADGLKMNIGKYCSVTILRSIPQLSSEDVYNGILKDATVAWLVLDQGDNVTTYLPMKEVYTVSFQPKPNK